MVGKDIRMRKTNYFFLLLLVQLLLACTTRDWPAALSPDEDGVGEGSVEVLLKGMPSTQTRATTSTITKEEADLFLVTITKGDDIVAQQKLLGKVGSMTFPAGYGYKVFVENITDVDAEEANDGWGAKRFTGLSKSFGIQAGQTSKVGVNCTVANAAISVNMAEGVEGCTVTISNGSRTLTTDEGGKVAYFNVSSGVVAVILKVEKNGTVVIEQDFSLSAAQVKDVNLTPSESESEKGSLDLTITYNDTFDVIPEEIIIPE